MATTNLKISVIIPNYNREAIISQTLDSLKEQHFENWEAIVVDDGSGDRSTQIVKEYQQSDERIHLYERDREPNGAPTCRNIGLENAKGDYVIFLDSDDLLAPHCLKQRMDTILKNPGLDFLVFSILMFTNTPNDAEYIWNTETDDNDLNRFLRLDAVWQTSGPIWKKQALNKIGGFTEGLACWQDVDIHLKALSSDLTYDKFYNLKPDIFYRKHEKGSISQGEISSPKKLRSRQKILIAAYNRLNRSMSPDLKTDFRIMGGSIVVGAARAIRLPIVKNLLSFGRQKGFFSRFFILKAYIVYLLHLSRLNRIGIFNSIIQKLIKKYRLDSNIGSIKYTDFQQDM